MARKGSLNFQVSQIIKKHNGVGKSKLESRNESGLLAESGHKVSNLFHSYKSLDNVRSDLTNLGKFAKEEFKIKNMDLINLNVIRSWIDSKNITYRSASNYLSEINKVREHLDVTQEEIKELRTELKKNLSRTTDLAKQTRAYKKLDEIEIQNRSKIAFQLQKEHGLRVKEATHINISRQLKDNILSYNQKGGKLSQIEISQELAENIRENAVDGIYQVHYRTYSRDLQKEIEKTGQKYNGTHGMRHSFAHKMLGQGYKLLEVSQMMGHSREEILKIYLR